VPGHGCVVPIGTGYRGVGSALAVAEMRWRWGGPKFCHRCWAPGREERRGRSSLRSPGGFFCRRACDSIMLATVDYGHLAWRICWLRVSRNYLSVTHIERGAGLRGNERRKERRLGLPLSRDPKRWSIGMTRHKGDNGRACKTVSGPAELGGNINMTG